MKKQWKIGIIFDTAVRERGSHGTHLAFLGLPDVKIAALADSNLDGIEERMRAAGGERHYVDWHEMIDREQPDIVILGSREPEKHTEAIEYAATRSCNILCEKPMTVDLEEADRIVAIAAEHRIKIAVAHLGRYALIFRTMKKMIESGAIGKPLTFYGRGKEDERGGGEDLMVLGTHILDLGCYLFGAPETVSGHVYSDGRPLRRTDRNTTSEPVGPVAGDDILAYFRFPGGVNGLFESRRDLFRGKQVRMGITVAGSEGALAMRYDSGERTLRLTHSPFPPEDEAHFEEVPLVEDLEIPGAEPIDYARFGFMKYFVDNNRFAAWDLMQAITEDRPPLASAADARLTQEMIQGIYASQLAGRVLQFPLTDRKHPLED